MIVTADIFQGELAIGQLGYADVREEVQLFIDKYEPVFLTELLGKALYDELNQGLSEAFPERRWKDLAEAVKPMTGCYIYYWFQRNKLTLTGGAGEVIPNTDSSIRTTSAEKMARAWNEMSRAASRFRHTIDSSVYPGYRPCLHSEIYHTINTFGI